MVESKKSRRSNTVDRIVLQDATQTQLKMWADQIQLDTNGSVSIPLRELANFVIQVRCSPITATEMDMIRDRYFDPIKTLQATMEEVRERRARGEKVDLGEMLKKFQMHSVAENRGAHRLPRARKTKVAAAPSAIEPALSAETATVVKVAR